MATPVTKTTVHAAGAELEFVLSDETVDRYGDVITAAGWKLSNFKKNPMALFNHDSDAPIGTWANVRVDGNRLLGQLNFAEKGTSQRIDELRSLSEQGILKAVSVGFKPIKSEPMDKNSHGIRFLEQELLETSLVTIPANPSAVQVARSLNISDDTMKLVFGEQAAQDRIVRRETHGKKADLQTKPTRSKAMKSLSQRIEDAQEELVAKRDTLTELTSADDVDVDAVEDLTQAIEDQERMLEALKRSEAKLAGSTGAKGDDPKAPAIRRPLTMPTREVSGLDLVVRGIVARGIAAFGPGDKTIDRVLDERYPGHEATAIVTKADQTIGTTTVSGWASELVQTAYADFLHALIGFSIYPTLRDRGIGLSFDGNGTVSIPSRTAGGAGGGFFAEGDPIRVGRITTAATTMTSKQMGVIVPFSRKLAMQSTPAIEALVRRSILEDTAAVLDPLLLDATAASSARPAGLLNGISAAASGYGGGDYLAVKEDFRALLAPFISANATDSITVVMNPSQGLNVAMMDGPVGNAGWFGAIRDRVNIVESTHATAGRLIALRNSDFATAIGDAPQFDVSEQATVHMEDTTPLEIVSGTGPTTADPVRSFWQTGTIGVRMIMDVSWKMRRSGMVQWIDGTTW